jgi:hypothetical protein
MKQRELIREIKVKEGQCNLIEVELYYNIGGMNYFSGTSEPRGLYLSVTPVTVTSAGGFKTRSYSAFSGVKTLVKELKRFSKKSLEDFEPNESDIDRMINHVVAKNGLKL